MSPFDSRGQITPTLGGYVGASPGIARRVDLPPAPSLLRKGVLKITSLLRKEGRGRSKVGVS